MGIAIVMPYAQLALRNIVIVVASAYLVLAAALVAVAPHAACEPAASRGLRLSADRYGADGDVLHAARTHVAAAGYVVSCSPPQGALIALSSLGRAQADYGAYLAGRADQQVLTWRSQLIATANTAWSEYEAARPFERIYGPLDQALTGMTAVAAER